MQILHTLPQPSWIAYKFGEKQKKQSKQIEQQEVDESDFSIVSIVFRRSNRIWWLVAWV